jgi:N-carbamoyl-L-amino-acid hydrolase
MVSHREAPLVDAAAAIGRDFGVMTHAIAMDLARTEAASELFAATRAQPGCLDYVWCADPGSESRVYVYERWSDTSSLAAHLADGGHDPDAVRAGRRRLEAPGIAAYIEVHIEQGPHLVKSGQRCAVVTAIRGNQRYKHCRVLGEYAHAGAVPRADRRDALLAGVEFVSGLDGMWARREASGEDLVCTVGQFYTDPAVHTITKIPGEVRFTLDFRSYDEAVLADCRAELDHLAARISKERAVAIDWGPPLAPPPR